MTNLRWKWISFHIYSNLTALIFILMLLAFMFWSQITQLSIDQIIYFIFVGLTGSVFLGLMCGFKFSKNMRNRLEEITIGAKSLAYGNLTYRLPFTDDKEIGDIALSFNEMARRIEEQVAALQKLNAENEELLLKARSTAVTEERQRLARDLHDAVSQQLFAISMTAATTARIMQKNPAKSQKLVENIEQSAAKAQAEMRALLLQLRPATLENQPLKEAVVALAQELEAKQTIRCELHLDLLDLPANIENQIYRVLQEGLSNVLRHSEATTVTIKLSQAKNSERVQLIIEDNGKGFSKEQLPQTSYGIKTIKERIHELGGTVDWLSYPGQGTRLEVHVPIMNNTREDGLVGQ